MYLGLGEDCAARGWAGGSNRALGATCHGGGAAIVHNTADTTELFAESGAQTIAPL